jgi:hypothetical protein
MAIIRGISVDGQLIPNANGTLYSTVGAGNSATRGVITSAVSYANTATSGVAIYVVPSGGSAGTSNQVASKDFALGEEYTWPELIGQSIESGGTLTGNDGANGGTGVNVILTVTEFTGDS